MARTPAVETLLERDHTLRGALVSVGHDALLDGSRARPGGRAGRSEARHRVRDDGARKLRVAGIRQPRGAGLAVAQRLERMVRRQGLVDVMEERGCLDQPPVDRDAGAPGAIGQERGYLRHHRHVLQQSRRGRGGHE